MTGRILKGVGGFYYALDEEGTLQVVRAQGKLRRERLKPKVGDYAAITPGNEDEHGWIQQILPRRNELTRPPVANIDCIALVVSAATPSADLMLADQLLIQARRASVAVQLVINKCELDANTAEAIARQYAGAQVNPIMVSARTGEGIPALRQALSGKTHAFAGQSGAGKSSLINALYGLDMLTGELSEKIERGKNTTRHCELIPIEGQTMVLDTPGFSLLEQDLIDPVELRDAYPEFAPYTFDCFFDPCYHAAEPKCGVRNAVAEGLIDAGRHARYCQLLEEARKNWRERYD